MDFATGPIITDFNRFFPVESEPDDGSRELVLVFERNGVKNPNNLFLTIFKDV